MYVYRFAAPVDLEQVHPSLLLPSKQSTAPLTPAPALLCFDNALQRPLI
jgi:hypothetical protein